MHLARWEPIRDLLTLQDRMNRVINEPYLRYTAPVEGVVSIVDTMADLLEASLPAAS